MAFSLKSTQAPDETFVIIGNGFDVECGLNTKYRDLLEFVREMKYDSPSVRVTPLLSVNWQDLRGFRQVFFANSSIAPSNGNHM